jgi:hypothetical protein
LWDLAQIERDIRELKKPSSVGRMLATFKLQLQHCAIHDATLDARAEHLALCLSAHPHATPLHVLQKQVIRGDAEYVVDDDDDDHDSAEESKQQQQHQSSEHERHKCVVISLDAVPRVCAVLQGHHARINGAVFAPRFGHQDDNRKTKDTQEGDSEELCIVTVSNDRRFKVWDVLKRVLLYQSAIVSSAAFTSAAYCGGNGGSERLVLGSSDGVLRIYNLARLACPLLHTVNLARTAVFAYPRLHNDDYAAVGVSSSKTAARP